MLLLKTPKNPTKPFYQGLLIFSLLAGYSNFAAAECGVLKLQKSRSPGTSVASNSCANSTELAVETVLKIPAGARLWLESTSALDDSEHFQIICQNKSTNLLAIKVNSAMNPWISPEITQCKGWVNDRLECNEPDSEKKALYCSIALIKPLPTNQPIERTTSLALRGLKHNEPKSLDSKISQEDIEQWSTYLRPEINLCRTVFQSTQKITLSGKIKTSGVFTGTKIKETDLDKQLAQCAIEVIENFDFPKVTEDTQITLSF